MVILQGTLKLVSKETVAKDTLKLRFEVRNLATLTGENFKEPFNFKPGQFVSIKFGEKSWRAYSIASLPEEDQLELVVRLVEGGVASEIFRTASPEDEYTFKGPFGHFVLSQNPDAHLVFCATGTGIAPFRGMIQQEAKSENPRSMTLLYGGRNTEDIAYLDELQTWSQELEIKLGLSRQEDHPTHLLDKEGAGESVTWEKARITHFLENKNWTDQSEFYICGNGDMVVDTQNILLEKGIAKSHIFMERFN